MQVAEGGYHVTSRGDRREAIYRDDQDRFKAILVGRDAYLLELARYVVLNPVRAGMVPEAADWPWSSYRAMVGEPKEVSVAL